MTYEELFDNIKLFNKEQRLESLDAGFDYVMSILVPACSGKEETAKTLLVMGLSTFMLADSHLEESEFELLQDFFLEDFTEDELIHTLRVGDDDKDKIIDGFIDFIQNNEEDFLDHFIIMGMIVCTCDGNISSNELELANKYVSAYMNK